MPIDPEAFEKHRPVQKDVLDALREEISLLPKAPESLLDIGCGTGNYSAHLASNFSLRLTGIDTSKEMLSKARRKLPEANWINENFLEWKSPHFDVILMIYVIHLFSDWRVAVRRAAASLNANGLFMIVTDGHADLSRSFVHMYVPKVLEIDLARFPKVEDVVHELFSLGLSAKIRSIVTEHTLETAASIEKIVESVKARYISTLRFLSDGELDYGVMRLRSQLMSQLSRGPIKRIRERSLIVARR